MCFFDTTFLIKSKIPMSRLNQNTGTLSMQILNC